MSSTDMGTATPAEVETPPNMGTNAAEDRTSNNSNGMGGSRNRGQSNNTNTFRISNFKGEVREVGAVIGTKSDNRTKDSMTLFHGKISSYVM